MYRPLLLILGLYLFFCGTTSPSLVAADEPTWPREWSLPSGMTYKLRGRIDTDAIWASQSEKNQADFGELGDVVGLRRARIGIEGQLPHDGSYVAEIDLAGGSVVIRDLYLAHSLRISGDERYGHFREPFSLEGGTSANYFAFMERSPANALDPARNWGVGLYELQPTEDTGLAIGGFYGGSDANDFESGDGSTVGLTAKLFVVPINEDDGRELLHLGIAVSERLPLRDVITISEGPQSSLLDFNDTTSSVFVPTIVIPADFQHILNAQIAYARGAWWTQAEWYGTFIDQIAGEPVFYHGSHVDIGVFLTGEHREYKRGIGVFGPVKVNRPVFCGPASHGRELGFGA